MKKILLKTLTSFNVNLRNWRGDAPPLRGSLLIPLLIVCFALLPGAQAAPEKGPAAPGTPQQAPTGPEIPANLNPRVMQLPATPDPGSVGGSLNTADGANALSSVTTGAANSAFGWFSLLSNAEGTFNTAAGAATLLFNTANNNTAVGGAALLFNTTGTANTAVGAGAMVNNIDGLEHTAVGFQALNANTTGNDNAAFGLFALLNNVDGSSNTALGTAALLSNVSGDNNQAIGRGALRFNEGSGNIAIGREAGATPPQAGQYNNTILLGIAGDADALDPDGRAYIGNVRGVTVANGDGINVLIDSTGQLGTSNSSRRFKKDIKPMDQTSEAILALKPVTFHYKNQDTKKAENTPQFGLIAEDVAEVNPDLVVCDADGKPFTVRYDAVNAMLLNEFLKEHKKVEEQQANIAQLNSKMANQAAIIAQQQKGMEVLTAQLKEQAAQIQKVSAQVETNKPAPQTVANK
jgi:uncharacterized coiled-coil protein SlyX